jgi:hypothetical protein
MLSGPAFVMVMQTAKLEELYHLPFVRILRSPRFRRVFAER